MNDRYERLSDYLIIGGLSSAQKYGLERANPKPDVSWLPEFEAEEVYKVLLMHEPQLWPEHISGRKIDLTVAGYAHGGQWRLFGRGVFDSGQGFCPKLTKCFYYDTRLLVSAELANTALVPRIFNQIELVIVEIGQ